LRTRTGFFIFTLFIAGVTLPDAAFAASKIKPDLPIGEELNAPAQVKPSGNSSAAPAAEPAHGNSPHGEEHDPYAAAPQTQGESAKPNASGDPSQSIQKSEKHESTGAHKAAPESGRLLEGKVPPATPPHGSGFIWFAVVFVVLAIAIFIFT
jgi:hypothetical protein